VYSAHYHPSFESKQKKLFVRCVGLVGDCVSSRIITKIGEKVPMHAASTFCSMFVDGCSRSAIYLAHLCQKFQVFVRHQHIIVKNMYKITTPQRAERSNTSFRKTGLAPRVISSRPLNGKGGVFSPLINKQFKAHQHQSVANRRILDNGRIVTSVKLAESY